jgi:hypothetical protein
MELAREKQSVNINEHNINKQPNTESYIDLSSDILNSILILIKDIDENNISQEFKLISNLFESINAFIQVTTAAYKELKLKREEKIQKLLNIKQLEMHLLSVIKAMHAAQQKNDNIMLFDLIAYELKDNLTQWKINIIPALKQKPSL